MSKQDYYDILGINKDATDKDVQKAFRQLAHKYHPDSNKTKEAEEKFKKINEAYNVLKDPEKRKAYDQFGGAWEQGQGFYSQDTSGWGGNEDILKQVFESIFRANGGSGGGFNGFGGFGSFNQGGYQGYPNHHSKGQDLETELTIEIKDSFFGGTKNIRISDGSGSYKTLDVNIPKGITEGQKIRLKGQGQIGYNGGPKGDLLIKVHIKDDKEYKLEGMDVYKELLITPWEAAFGKKVNVTAFDKNIEINIPEGTDSGVKFRLKGKGLSNSKKTGDFYFITKIVIPKELSKEEEKLLKKWEKASKFDPRA
ncbi:curved DNA-binding protein [Natranaerovirga pectinivora]|uniref:Curved DNA-binding protein n=1 Tax=Natranaerovirga pectinivora TaxID=682400 RepID=A0A4R3MQT5_9FIRM|nr:J domain-containing protein [Natranaerovirga pectinivora]TCT15541.1 curved DNA-binding protein [Natranaerovirga pectinivora]